MLLHCDFLAASNQLIDTKSLLGGLVRWFLREGVKPVTLKWDMHNCSEQRNGNGL